MGKITRNTLFYGDNLDILRQYIDDESIDLIYLDPPFNSNRSYNVLFKDESGSDSEAQIIAFDDSWHWGETAEETYFDIINKASPDIASMISALRDFIGTNQMMAYIVMMAIRLMELKRVLKSDGSLYLHCDPTASHYLKILLDTIFGAEHFQNEIIWKRTFAHSGANRWGDVHDTIFFYTKSSTFTWNEVFQDYEEKYLNTKYRYSDHRGNYRHDNLTGAGVSSGESGKEWRGYNPTSKGRHWATPTKIIEKLVGKEKASKLGVLEKLDLLYDNSYIYISDISRGEGKSFPQLKKYIGNGVPIQSVINDISPINSQAIDRLGYPTQKPIELLERIISASSNQNDIILDPFSGCGTAITASQKLDRYWIGIDITQLAIALHKNRLKDMFGLEPEIDYEIIGEPQSLHDAEQLAQSDRFQFEWWALSLIEARPYGGKKRGSDRGIDGVITFTDDAKGNAKQVLVQVKSGHVNSGLIRDFRGTIERENNAVMGIFITLAKPSKNMETEALEAGYYVSPYTGQKHLKIQIYTIEELLDGKEPDLPVSASFSTFKKAQKVNKDHDAEQGKLDL